MFIGLVGENWKDYFYCIFVFLFLRFIFKEFSFFFILGVIEFIYWFKFGN